MDASLIIANSALATGGLITLIAGLAVMGIGVVLHVFFPDLGRPEEWSKQRLAQAEEQKPLERLVKAIDFMFRKAWADFDAVINNREKYSAGQILIIFGRWVFLVGVVLLIVDVLSPDDDEKTSSTSTTGTTTAP
jgi:hypothetical protein